MIAALGLNVGRKIHPYVSVTARPESYRWDKNNVCTRHASIILIFAAAVLASSVFE